MEQIKNAWYWLVAWKQGIEMFVKFQAMRERLYKETGEYERFEVVLDDELAIFWPLGSRFPTPITPAIKLAYKVREEAHAQEMAEHPERFHTETTEDGIKVTTEE